MRTEFCRGGSAKVGPPLLSPRSYEHFEALISWFGSDEAMRFPLAEVEKRLEAEVAKLLRHLRDDYAGAGSGGLGSRSGE